MAPLLLMCAVAGCSTPKTNVPLYDGGKLRNIQTSYQFSYRFPEKPAVDKTGISLVLARIVELRLGEKMSESEMYAFILANGDQQHMAENDTINSQDIDKALKGKKLYVKWVQPRFGLEQGPSLRALRDKGFKDIWPVIALVQDERGRQVVLVDGVDADNVYVSAPQGNFAVRHEAFSKMYLAVGIVLKRS